MSTVGWKKSACKRGHVNPLRNKFGACVPCSKVYRVENYRRDRERFIARSAERARLNPDARRDEQRAWRMGVPVAEIRRVISESNGVCGACECPLPHAKMCVDHDHATGVVRGVLCRFCNALEGMLNKKPERVAQVQRYLSHHVDREIKRLGGK